MNSYPFLDNKLRILSDAELGDIVRPFRKTSVIDISTSPLVAASELRYKLDRLLMNGELDGAMPLLRHNNVLHGLIAAPELEFALDNLQDEENTLCLMTTDSSWLANPDDRDNEVDWVDFAQYIDPVCIYHIFWRHSG